MGTFKVKLGCDNCGHDQFFSLPRRSVIIDWLPAMLSNEGLRPSSYHPVGKPDKQTILRCRFCGLARLKVFWFKEEEARILSEQREGINGSADSRNSSE